MRLYLADAGPGIDYQQLAPLTGKGLAFTVSYTDLVGGLRYWDFVAWCREHDIPLLLNSGAAAAMAHGEVIDVSVYTTWLLEHGDKFEHISALEVIGDPDASWENYKRMIDAGIDAVPLHVPGAPLHHLERLTDTAPLVALGRSTGRQKVYMSWLTAAFEAIAKTNSEAHGCEVVNGDAMAYFPWASIASTKWLGTLTWGRMLLKRERNLQWPRVTELAENPVMLAQALGSIPGRAGSGRDEAPSLYQGAVALLSWVNELNEWRTTDH